jgi:transposase InsO family protein
MLFDAIHNLLLTSQERYTHLLPVEDRSSRWIEAITMVSTLAQACANTVIGGWVARFATPAIITSDRGPQFTSAVWTVLCQKLGIQHILTTADHPQANNMVERFHRQLKETLRPRNCDADGPAFALHLFALRPPQITGAGRSLYRRRRPRAADRDEFKVKILFQRGPPASGSSGVLLWRPAFYIYSS